MDKGHLKEFATLAIQASIRGISTSIFDGTAVFNPQEIETLIKLCETAKIQVTWPEDNQ